MEDFQIFGRFLENVQIFRKFSDFWKILRLSDFWKIFRVLEDFQIFGKFSDFWETTTATKTILGLVTFETLITLTLTIENLTS